MTSEPATPNIDLAFAAGKEEGKFEARAAAERDVAALREAIEEELSDVRENDPFEAGSAAAYNFVLSLLANPAAAEPRWPRGPEAERELAAALHGFDCADLNLRRMPWEELHGAPSRDFDRNVHLGEARRLIAALQEKRDPGE